MKWGVRNSSGSNNSNISGNKYSKKEEKSLNKATKKAKSLVNKKYLDIYNSMANESSTFYSKINNKPEYKKLDLKNNPTSKLSQKYLKECAAAATESLQRNSNKILGNSIDSRLKVSWTMSPDLSMPTFYIERDNPEIKHTSIEGDINMKKNIFDNDSTKENNNVLTRDELQQIFKDARQSQSTIKNSFLAHGFDSISEAYEAYEAKQSGSLKHSITNIEYLFPDYKTVGGAPVVLAPREEWVSKVFNQARHIPFSRIKTIVADITKDEARALGYIKGNEKAEEVFSLLKRTTDAQTIYKKQRIDRDDVVDITDFDVIVWLRNEMRGRLEAELARAILVSDGRSAASDDKINETKVRPIATDDPLYTIPVVVSPEDVDKTEPTTSEIIDAVIRSRKDYKGSGTPNLYVRSDILGDMLLLKDSLGRRIYETIDSLASALRVKEIIEVQVMDIIVNPNPTAPYSELAAVLVNMSDY
jgi:hypothetical protein